MPGKNSPGDGDLLATIARQTVAAKLTKAAAETQAAPGSSDTEPDDQEQEQDQDQNQDQDADAEDEETDPKDSPTPTSSPRPPATNTPIPCNWAAFVDDVTYADGTEVVAGTTFTKTWRLRNIGTCSWTSGYSLIYNSGDRMSAPDSTSVTGGTVAPGATVDVSVNLTAPDSPGTYQGNFMLRSPDNIVFGIGGSASSYFWVKIEVIPADTATPTVTSTPTSTLTPTSTPTNVPEPDLIISQLDLNPATPTVGNPVDVSVSVYNQGNAVAVGPFVVEWYPGEGYASPACTWTVSNVPALGGFVQTCTYAGYPSHYASIVTKAIADTTDTVDESEEGNNSASLTITVNP
jgi:hypothetical protein